MANAEDDYQFANVKLPVEFTPNVVVVTDIGLDATEKVVRDFFSFCGSINQFEMVPTIDGQSQKAFIEFEKESAARTALLLSNAVIGGNQIRISPYFSEIPPYESPKTEPSEEEIAAAASDVVSQEDKPKTSVITEILAAGYVLTDQIVESAKAFDDKHGVTPTFLRALDDIKLKSAEIDEKYKIAETSKGVIDAASRKASDLYTNMDQKYQINQKAGAVTLAAKTQAAAIDEKYQVREQINQALQSEPAQKVSSFLGSLYLKARQIHEEAKRTAAEREGKVIPVTPEDISTEPIPTTSTPAVVETDVNVTDTAVEKPPISEIAVPDTNPPPPPADNQ